MTKGGKGRGADGVECAGEEDDTIMIEEEEEEEAREATRVGRGVWIR